METNTQNQTAVEKLIAAYPELKNDPLYKDILSPTIYLSIWESVVDGELTISTKAFNTLEKSRNYQKEVVIPRIKKEWDITDSATEYDMNEDYDEGETIVESGTDYFSVYENGNAVLYREDAYIRPLAVE